MKSGPAGASDGAKPTTTEREKKAVSTSEDTYEAALNVVYRVLEVMQEGKLQACKAADDTGDPAKIFQASGEYCGVLDAKVMVGRLIESIRGVA